MDYSNTTIVQDELLRGWIDKHTRLKELVDIKRKSEAILDDDTVNSWGENHTPNYTPEQVKQAAEDFNEAQKEIDRIISEL